MEISEISGFDNFCSVLFVRPFDVDVEVVAMGVGGKVLLVVAEEGTKVGRSTFVADRSTFAVGCPCGVGIGIGGSFNDNRGSVPVNN